MDKDLAIFIIFINSCIYYCLHIIGVIVMFNIQKEIATANDITHAVTPSSNRGICNTKTGECECESGFVGSACERLECPNSCSKHGKCLTMQNYGEFYRNDLSVQYDYETIWDATKIKGCVCDSSYSGYDCSLANCPMGTDPLTTGVNTVQLLVCIGGEGSFILFFKGYPSLNIPYNADAATVSAALLAIPGILGINVTFSIPSAKVVMLS